MSASEDGEVFVAKAGQLAQYEMKEVIMTTPDGLVVVRTAGHIYGIGGK